MQAEGDVIRFPAAESAPPDFAAFFAEEHAGLFKALFFVTGNRADAADLAQDAFLKKDCEARAYGPGDAFVELPSTVHIGRNETGDIVELGVVFFGVPVGGSPRIDQPQPDGCEIT
jgi:hypothetical protein